MERPQPTFQVDGAAIRTRRKDLGMSLATCARAAGISKSFLVELETGAKRVMRPPTYAGLRTALRIQSNDRRLLAPPEEQHRKEPDGRQEGASRPRPDIG
ncbi:helix-turn-helix domain-containing protein [Streptomyces sp. NPDC017086]|uniref:helix-turn-helix domain-containing protein n=1 Tax=Streptomyces sp. NPDC017086 TaxID=3364976 RepID=UPI0037B2D735